MDRASTLSKILTTPTGATMLHMAAGGMGIGECGMFLKGMRIDVNAVDFSGRTPLFEAIAAKNRENALFLIENDADVKWRAFNGERPLHAAVKTGSMEIVEFLISKGCDVDATDGSERTSLFLAIFQKSPEIVRFLIENGANVNWSAMNGETPLHFAANRGSKEMVELLVSKGADIHANSFRGTPLHYAAASGNSEVLGYLLELKADPNASSSVDATPFFKALMADYTSIECLEQLIEVGADPHRASYLTTPLEYAVTKCDEGVIIFLLQSGADPDMLDIMGLKPVEKAALEGRLEVVKLLYPLTSRIEGYTNWSVNGLMNDAKLRAEKVQSKSKLKELSLLAKAKGEEAFERKHYFDAATWYKKALGFDPIGAEIWSNRSLCYTMMKNGKKALKYAKECIALKPDWATAHHREGAAWRVLKDFEKAANAFSKALALEPHNELINEELSAVRAEVAEAEERDVHGKRLQLLEEFRSGNAESGEARDSNAECTIS